MGNRYSNNIPIHKELFKTVFAERNYGVRIKDKKSTSISTNNTYNQSISNNTYNKRIKFVYVEGRQIRD